MVSQKNMEGKLVWIVTGHADAQNVYGAVTRRQWRIILQKINKKWTPVYIENGD